MFTEANGDRPNPPYSNTIVLLSSGFSFSVYADIEGFDRKIAIGIAGNVSPTLLEFASSDDDYKKVANACQLSNFLNSRLLCEEFPAAGYSTCPVTSSTPWIAGGLEEQAE